MPPTEQDVITAIRSGSERDFEAVFRQHYASLCRYARQLLPDPDEAEEEVQAMFLAIWEKREGLLISVSLKSYLYRSVHNRCLNRLKHAAVRDEHRDYIHHIGEETAESPAQRVIGEELAHQIQRAIQKLPEQCRLVFTLSRYEELRYGEIAEQLGISIKTVENQIGKALRILRAELSEYLPVVLALGINNGQWILNPGSELSEADMVSLLTIFHSSLSTLHFI
ncbi:RNA polymerase sigma-70 factor [Spirosoma aerolatum]|uniref:RNA polymerase sigma-70 factor n=1 Tax=Spirosoma aerolatum TaxID=1211326 RepID=UPI0029373148|nr:RNA polymerase sigma-70 factor [Spirosoma aerolatum]